MELGMKLLGHSVAAMIVALPIIAGLSSESAADKYQDATLALRSSDYDAAKQLLQPMAEQGDARAQTSLG